MTDDDDWFSLTRLGSVYEEETNAKTGEYRHRRIFPNLDGRIETSWVPGRAPGRKEEK